VTRRTHTITLVDGRDNSDFDMHEFYKHWQQNTDDWQVALIKCNLSEIVEFTGGSADSNKNVDPLKSGKESWTTLYTFDSITEPDPLDLGFKIQKSVLSNLT
jgi:hypothetical protein